MHALLQTDLYPIDQAGVARDQLIAHCRAELAQDGMTTLDAFLRPEIAETAARDLAPLMAEDSFEHRRSHNIYFRDEVEGLAPDHPALARRETVNHTLCADQLSASPVVALYEWPPLVAFLAAIMDKPALHLMQDPLARVNVMSYRAGEALNWHFDRSEFTVTLLLQAPEGGGVFQYRPELRSDEYPNHDGVACLLSGQDPDLREARLSPGALNIFRGRNTPHRVTPVEGAVDRMIAVFSYFDRPGVAFTAKEQIGFYGRAG